jgi:hypothetical protein
MRLVHSLRKVASASALIKHQRAGTSSYFASCAKPARPHRQTGLHSRACLAPLRSAPTSLPIEDVASMGRSKANADKQGKSNTSCYIQVCTPSPFAAAATRCHAHTVQAAEPWHGSRQYPHSLRFIILRR